jgi:hypothetical protein
MTNDLCGEVLLVEKDFILPVAFTGSVFQTLRSGVKRR